MVGYVAGELVELVSDVDEKGPPETGQERLDRVAAAVANIAQRTAANRNDEPVTPAPQPRPSPDLSALSQRLAEIRRLAEERAETEQQADRGRQEHHARSNEFDEYSTPDYERER